MGKISKIAKLIWVLVGSLILTWIGYLIYKIYTVPGPGVKLLAIFLLMMGIAMLLIFLLITFLGKIITFITKRKR